jgi:hypothetical protein
MIVAEVQLVPVPAEEFGRVVAFTQSYAIGPDKAELLKKEPSAA